MACKKVKYVVQKIEMRTKTYSIHVHIVFGILIISIYEDTLVFSFTQLGLF